MTATFRWTTAFLFATLCICAVRLLAQDASPIALPESHSLGSTLAVGAFTFVISAGISRSFSDAPFLKAVPIWVYVILVGIGLTYFGNRVTHTLPGDNFWSLVWDGIVNAFSTIGVHSTVTDGTWKRSIEESTARRNDA